MTRKEMADEADRIAQELRSAGIGCMTFDTFDGAIQIEDDDTGPAFYILIEKDGSASGALITDLETADGLDVEFGPASAVTANHPFVAAVAAAA